MKVLKAKMFRMIKKLIDRFLITTRWRHLVDYFEISHLKALYAESAQSKDVQSDKKIN